MNALRVARNIVDKHGERGVELATNRYLRWFYWVALKPRDLKAAEKCDFWRRTSFRAAVLFNAKGSA